MARALRRSRRGQLEQRRLTVVARNGRALVAGGIALLTVLAWAQLGAMSSGMNGMDTGAMAMPDMRRWTWGDAGALFAMWSVMMIAMMLPSAAPTILLVDNVVRTRRARGTPGVPVGVFVAGYLAAWIVFSAVAALAQWGLHRAALLSPAMATASPQLGGALLLLAGASQWLPLKNTCLSHCRSPIGWLTAEWREGTRGAFVMGLRHGTYCLGCCWALMPLLFVLGVMNLLWVAAIAALVLVEKVAPGGRVIGRVAGLGLAAWGGVLLAH